MFMAMVLRSSSLLRLPLSSPAILLCVVSCRRTERRVPHVESKLVFLSQNRDASIVPPYVEKFK